jgi:hypothetical protein
MPYTHLNGRRLIIARVIWLALFFISLALFIVAIPFHITQLHVICDSVTCSGSQSTTEIVRELYGLGLSLNAYNLYTIVIEIIFAMGYFTVAAIIFWRKSDDWMVLLLGLFLVTFVLIFANVPNELAKAYPNLWLPVASIGLIGVMAFPLSFYLFPDGRFVPRWIPWLLPVWMAWGILTYFFPNSALTTNTWYLAIESVAFVCALASIVFVQVYRYRYVSSSAQRQQTKWIVFGMVVGLGGFFGSGLLGFVLPRLLSTLFSSSALPSPALFGVVAITVSYLVMLAIPLSIGFSILRYRLWDIDLLINRTLVYGTLSVLLAVMYVASILVLQQFLSVFTAQSSGVAIVGSTLAIVALIQPLLHRIQATIDRHFYRPRYDSLQILAAFNALLRDEVDIERVTELLLTVVEDTIQPKHVSLWLRKPQSGRASNYLSSGG